MNNAARLMGGIGAGALLMYFLDPDRGRRRRVGLRDKAIHAGHQIQREAGKAGRDLRNRMRGVAAETRSRIKRSSMTDSDLIPRVRAKLGRFVRNPHAIEVTASGGTVLLTGDVLRSEVDRLLAAIARIRGVKEISNRLTVHDSAGDNPNLQGRRVPAGEPSAFNKTKWTPALRVLAGFGGGALATYGILCRGIGGAAAGLAGLALVARSTANQNLRQVLGGDGGPAVEVRKTAHIQASPEEVFRFLTSFTNLPRFMSHLVEVRDLGNGLYHWVAEGPAGLPISWNARITRFDDNRLVEWRSEEGSAIETEGTMRFDADNNGGTRVTVQMCYRPPGGMLGHSMAVLLGADPKREIDDDFVRLKSLIENGKTRAHGRLVTSEVLSTMG
jgi:uncharacterized membrane protein